MIDKSGAGSLGTFWILVLAAMAMGVGILPYLDPPSILLVLGGTLTNTIASFELAQVKKAPKAMKAAFTVLNVEDNINIVQKIIFYAMEVKKKGVMSIEQKVLQEQNPFFKEAFQLLVDGSKPELIRYLLETKMEHIDNRHKEMIELFGAVGGTAGAMGMVGTLVGLVAMLANLSDPSAVGPAMAVALLTTLYGSLLGVGFANPISKRLEVKNTIEMTGMSVVVEGVVMVASDESISDIKMKLNAILQDQ